MTIREAVEGLIDVAETQATLSKIMLDRLDWHSLALVTLFGWMALLTVLVMAK